MSVATTADMKITSAREHVAAAIKDLTEILIDECWGHDELSEEYKVILEKTFNHLRQIKREL